jgi:hypothetical protein
MSSAALDRLLAALIAAQLLTGLVSLRAGSPPTAPLFVIHGLLGGALLAAVAWKLWRSVPGALAHGRWWRLGLASMLAALVIAALVGGFTWVASGRIIWIGPWTILTLHVIAALLVVPIAIAHLVPKRWRLLRPNLGTRSPRHSTGRRLTRRALLAGGTLAVVGVAAWAGSNLLDALRGGVRRFTGSRWLPRGGIPPPTTFFGETTGPIDQAAWRLRVHGRVARSLALSLADIGQLAAARSTAVLDCTSGWALETDWDGTSLASVLDLAGVEPDAELVTIRAVTGWYCRMPLDEARSGALLATKVAGQPLPHANGAPLRLVAPDRRGLEWVKWVTEVEVT